MTPWRILFPFTCWLIWKARNKKVYENYLQSAKDVVQQAKASALEFIMFNTTLKANITNTVLIGWSPPPPGFLKLNTDGASSTNPGHSGSGGVIRDHLGGWIKGYIRNIGYTTSFAAELWGLRDGLILADSLNIKKLIIELDAQAVIHAISNLAPNVFSQYMSLIGDCRALLQRLEEFRIEHIHREGNQVADMLSKEGLKLNGSFLYFDNPPGFVIAQHYADAKGSKYPRHICT